MRKRRRFWLAVVLGMLGLVGPGTAAARAAERGPPSVAVFTPRIENEARRLFRFEAPHPLASALVGLRVTSIKIEPQSISYRVNRSGKLAVLIQVWVRERCRAGARPPEGPFCLTVLVRGPLPVPRAQLERLLVTRLRSRRTQLAAGLKLVKSVSPQWPTAVRPSPDVGLVGIALGLCFGLGWLLVFAQRRLAIGTPPRLSIAGWWAPGQRLWLLMLAYGLLSVGIGLAGDGVDWPAPAGVAEAFASGLLRRQIGYVTGQVVPFFVINLVAAWFAIGATYRLASAVADERAGLLAAGILASNPWLLAALADPSGMPVLTLGMVVATGHLVAARLGKPGGLATYGLAIAVTGLWQMEALLIPLLHAVACGWIPAADASAKRASRWFLGVGLVTALMVLLPTLLLHRASLSYIVDLARQSRGLDPALLLLLAAPLSTLGVLVLVSVGAWERRRSAGIYAVLVVLVVMLTATLALGSLFGADVRRTVPYLAVGAATVGAAAGRVLAARPAWGATLIGLMLLHNLVLAGTLVHSIRRTMLTYGL